MEMDIEGEQKTEAYKVTLNFDIENIEKIENIYKHYKKMEENLPNYTTRVL